jgi:hypothetical protein
MRRHRTKTGVQQRLIDCLRLREGKYDPTQLAEIAKFGGSKVFANITHNKCRGAAAMLRDIFLGKERPWAIEPTPDPTLPTDAMANVLTLVRTEVAAFQQQGSRSTRTPSSSGSTSSGPPPRTPARNRRRRRPRVGRHHRRHPGGGQLLRRAGGVHLRFRDVPLRRARRPHRGDG